MQLKRVVVTGIGSLTPLGNNTQDYWAGLLNGTSGANAITLFDASKFKTRFACELKGFDPLQYLDKKEARKVDRYTQIAVAASDEAVTDAGIDKEKINPDRVGVVFASGIGGLVSFQDEVINFAKGDGTPRFNPFFIPKMILDIAAEIAIELPPLSPAQKAEIEAEIGFVTGDGTRSTPGAAVPSLTKPARAIPVAEIIASAVR